MLLVYGDESLDGTQSRVCAVAGVIGTEEMWRDLEPKWIERNAGTPFHATDCESGHGDYEGRPVDERKTLYKDLAILIAESGFGGFASAQDLAAQRKAFPSPMNRLSIRASWMCWKRYAMPPTIAERWLNDP